METGRLNIGDGAQISAATFGEGAGGSLAVRASGSVELIGTSADRQFASSLTAQARGSGDAGDLILTAGQLSVRDGAQVTVSGVGAGEAGSLEVTARSIGLENRGAIVAETASAQGGNITLQAQDSLLMRNNSRISTTAGFASGGGNGDNIIIDTPFIIATPSEDNNITANALLVLQL